MHLVASRGARRWTLVLRSSAAAHFLVRPFGHSTGVGPCSSWWPRRRRSLSATRRKRSSVEADPERLEKGLAQLVLTLVELLRELMERQALRRVDDGTLSDEEIDRLGETFRLLEQRMEELKDVFGLTDDDLNMNLGPLGNLL
jgi:gas vesicle protein GvpK